MRSTVFGIGVKATIHNSPTFLVYLLLKRGYVSTFCLGNRANRLLWLIARFIYWDLIFSTAVLLHKKVKNSYILICF